jgi:hypothetical protein
MLTCVCEYDTATHGLDTTYGTDMSWAMAPMVDGCGCQLTPGLVVHAPVVSSLHHATHARWQRANMANAARRLYTSNLL